LNTVSPSPVRAGEKLTVYVPVTPEPRVDELAFHAGPPDEILADVTCASPMLAVRTEFVPIFEDDTVPRVSNPPEVTANPVPETASDVNDEPVVMAFSLVLVTLSPFAKLCDVLMTPAIT
jgi:hypothetical protein